MQKKKKGKKKERLRCVWDDVIEERPEVSHRTGF